jgi:Protein of unknown function (DUF1672)
MILTRKTGFALLGILLLGGCSIIEKKEDNPYVRVQDYTGKEYRLPNGDKNDKIAEASKEKVISGTEEFFLKKYKTKVKVNNIVGNKDGASVYVESVGEPYFHTFAVIPIDTHENARPEGIWTQEGEVEGSIKSGIYALIHEKNSTSWIIILKHLLRSILELDSEKRRMKTHPQQDIRLRIIT